MRITTLLALVLLITMTTTAEIGQYRGRSRGRSRSRSRTYGRRTSQSIPRIARSSRRYYRQESDKNSLQVTTQSTVSSSDDGDQICFELDTDTNGRFSPTGDGIPICSSS